MQMYASRFGYSSAVGACFLHAIYLNLKAAAIQMQGETDLLWPGGDWTDIAEHSPKVANRWGNRPWLETMPQIADRRPPQESSSYVRRRHIRRPSGLGRGPKLRPDIVAQFSSPLEAIRRRGEGARVLARCTNAVAVVVP